MVKYFSHLSKFLYKVVAVGLLTSQLLACASRPPYAIKVHSAEGDVVVTKVAFVTGDIDDGSATDFAKQMEATKSLPGPRLIIINSRGGYIGSGLKILASIMREKAEGVPIVCIVDHKAMSMAFVIYSQCDLRFATAGSMLLFHNGALSKEDMPDHVRLTADVLREMADDLSATDMLLGEMEAKALGLSVENFNLLARQEMTLPAEFLMAKGFIATLVTIEPIQNEPKK